MKAAAPTVTCPAVRAPGPNDTAKPISLSWPTEDERLRLAWQPMTVFDATTTPAFT